MEIVFKYSMEDYSWSTPGLLQVENSDLSYLISADRAGYIYAINLGKNLGTIAWKVKIGDVFTASPCIADIDGDGRMEILIGDHSGVCHAIRQDGSILWQQRCGSMIRSTIAVADVNGDGKIEVIVAGYGNYLFCLEGDTGRIIYKKFLGKKVYINSLGIVSSPLIADIDDDGYLEIVIGTRNKLLACLDAASGEAKWYKFLQSDPDSSPRCSKLSGQSLIFFGGGEFTNGYGDKSIFALDGKSGKVIWRRRVDGGLDSSPVIRDINGNGKPELLISSLADASLYCLDAFSGVIHWQYKIEPTPECIHDVDNICRPNDGRPYRTGDAICRSYTTPLVSDLGGAGNFEVIFGSNNGTLFGIDGSSGKRNWKLDLGKAVRASPVAIPIIDNSQMGLVVISGNIIFCFISNHIFHYSKEEINTTLPLNYFTSGRSYKEPILLRLKFLFYVYIWSLFNYIHFHIDRRFFNIFGIITFESNRKNVSGGR